jgi:hypothetical protein
LDVGLQGSVAAGLSGSLGHQSACIVDTKANSILTNLEASVDASASLAGSSSKRCNVKLPESTSILDICGESGRCVIEWTWDLEAIVDIVCFFAELVIRSLLTELIDIVLHLLL